MKTLLLILFLSLNAYAYPLGVKGNGLTTKYPALIDLGTLTATSSGSTVTVTGLLSAITSKTGSYTLTASDRVVYWDVSGGSATATLPTAVGNSGLQLTISLQNAGTQSLSINTTSGQTISGIASGAITMSKSRDSITVISNGTNWTIISKTFGDNSAVEYYGNIDTIVVSFGGANLAAVCSSSPCTTLSQIGAGVSSITRNGSGDYTLNLLRAYGKLMCNGNFDTSGVVGIATPVQCTSCSSLTFSVQRTTSSVPTDSYGTLICYGSY